MMKQEFETLAGYEVTSFDYYNIIEPMYMATSLSKAEFVKTINKARFALPTKAQMRHEMRKLALEIFYGCGRREFVKEEMALQDLAWKYAERFYHVIPGCRHEYVYFTRDWAYCGVRQDRGCTFPETLVIGYSDEIRDIEYERFTLVK